MNVLILMGSPRLLGNTAELCKPFMEELKENGAEVRYVTLADKDIRPCKGCYACQEVGAPPGAESSDLSEWPRSADDAAAPSARNMPGTATGFPDPSDVSRGKRSRPFFTNITSASPLIIPLRDCLLAFAQSVATELQNAAGDFWLPELRNSGNPG